MQGGEQRVLDVPVAQSEDFMAKEPTLCVTCQFLKSYYSVNGTYQGDKCLIRKEFIHHLTSACKDYQTFVGNDAWQCTECGLVNKGAAQSCVNCNTVRPPAEPPEGLKYDDKKLRYDLLDFEVLDQLVQRFTHGANKYGANNWQKLDNPTERYSGALLRHLSAYRQGEKMDPDAPGLTHLSAVLWNAFVLTWFELHK